MGTYTNLIKLHQKTCPIITKAGIMVIDDYKLKKHSTHKKLSAIKLEKMSVKSTSKKKEE